MAKKKEINRDAEVSNLFDSLSTLTDIGCDKCGDSDTVDLDGYEAAEFFQDKGWRSPTGKTTYCPSCAKEHLKSK